MNEGSIKGRSCLWKLHNLLGLHGYFWSRKICAKSCHSEASIKQFIYANGECSKLIRTAMGVC